MDVMRTNTAHLRLSFVIPVVRVPLLVCERGDVGSQGESEREEQEREQGESAGHHCRPGHR